MNKEIMKACGFEKEVKEVENHICPFCHKKVDETEFISNKEKSEFKISGLCHKCQKEMFG